jgi:Resolvase, N terminal domain
VARHLIGYVRVSISKQGRSGLGIEAQREALQRFATAEGFELNCLYVEVETGKGFDALDRRPQLKAALLDARRQRCPVAVAKLDRLSRDVHFISGLMTHRVPFLDRGSWSGYRSVYLAPLRRAGTERASLDQPPHGRSSGRGQG